MIRFAIAFAPLTLAAGAAVAEEMPTPQMFRDAPFQKGQWKMNVLEMRMKGAKQQGHRPRSITLCMENLRDMGRNRAAQEGGRRSRRAVHAVGRRFRDGQEQPPMSEGVRADREHESRHDVRQRRGQPRDVRAERGAHARPLESACK